MNTEYFLGRRPSVSDILKCIDITSPASQPRTNGIRRQTLSTQKLNSHPEDRQSKAASSLTLTNRRWPPFQEKISLGDAGVMQEWQAVVSQIPDLCSSYGVQGVRGRYRSAPLPCVTKREAELSAGWTMSPHRHHSRESVEKHGKDR
ncbi:hypothetical protein TESG_07495 [Trichophyton tonsurans CBS 112818]|uniref:Uncharacterized protein n=1 Tax=Trichophyton tonsurans (strain CBS 112818) TaxID=647933 RepID=F2S9C5_TRIT1|nr:hypothetical protein TESG_07495 [Trichophyton tonsurans CBS 112818]